MIAPDEHAGEDGLGVLLLGVVQEAGEGDGRKGPHRVLGLAQGLLGLGDQGRGPLGLEAVDGPDGAAGRPDGAPAGGRDRPPGPR